jgi:hypothetical protein
LFRRRLSGFPNFLDGMDCLDGCDGGFNRRRGGRV